MSGLSSRVWGFGIVPALMASLTLLGCSARSDEDVDAQLGSELGERAEDATGVGPLATTSAEYKFDAAVDPDVLGDRATELWARVYRPANLTATQKHPLLVFLHGNHGTCGTGENPRRDNNSQYTMSGTCPPGYVVVPNHLGYGYLAERLASWGYIVVSINANRGITAGGGVSGDNGLNLARGRLILKHLQKLSEWNAQAGTTPASLGFDLAGLVDFDNVGFMGHSRGGEGVRAAYVQYHDAGSPWPGRIQAPLNVKGIFEIGPVDGQTGRRLDAMGTAWNVILPMCDGDVSNLQGMKPFDRMLVQNTETRATSKGMFAVWGANHNFYNTEWQTSDSRGCVGTGHAPLFAPSGQIASLSQQATGLYSMMGFFRAHVGDGAASAFNNTFDPKFGLPEGLESITRIQRAYIDSADAEHAIALENFTQTGTAIAQNVAVTYGSVPEHDALLRAAMVTWEAGGEGTYFEVPFASGGVNASGFETFDFRVSLTDNASAATVAAGPVDFSVQLVTGDGTLSKAVKLGSYVELVGNGGHRVLETARIPAGDFGVDLASVRGARFVFDGTAAGKVYLTNLRFSKAVQGKSLPAQLGNPLALNDQGSPNARPPIRVTTGNQVNELRRAAGEGVEIDLSSTTEFPISDELPRLRIGGQDVTLSRYADDGDSRHVIFTLTDGEFAAAQDGAALQVRYGDETATIEWDFGNLSKGAVR